MRPLTPLALLLVLEPATAQGDFDLDKRTSGAVGQAFELGFAGARPGSTLLYMLSTNAGPTPLALVDPSDPRQLAVGLDLAFGWFTLPASGGSGTVPLPVPNQAALAGLQLHFQMLTAPGTTHPIDQVSNPVVAQFGVADAPLALPATLVAARSLGAIVLDAQSPGGGDVLIAGGGQGGLVSATGLRSTERYTFRTLTVGRGPLMTTARALAGVVRLPDGRTLLTGGVDATGNVLASCEFYDPATDRFVATGDMSRPRAIHAAALLQDGRVLVAGGTSSFADPVAALANAQDTCEIWNPSTGTWSSARTLPDRLLAPALTALQDGRVLLTGGFDIDSFLGIPIPIGSITACRLYDPASNAWTSAASLRAARGAHTYNTVRLTDGRVLVTGGARSGPDLQQATAIADAEVYDPQGDVWTALPAMAVRRAGHSVTVLPSGRVVVAGGADGTISAPIAQQSVEELDPTTRTWRPLQPLVTPRTGHAAALTPDGLLVLFGGQGPGGQATLASIETLR